MFRKKLLGLLSDASVYGISSMMTRLVGLVLLPILSEYLTREDYGIVSMLTVVSALYFPLANLGMTNAVFRRFNLDKDPIARAGVLTTGLVSVAISSCLLLVITQILAPQIAQIALGDATYTNLVRISLVASAFSTVSMIPFVTLRAARRVKTTAIMNVAKVIVSATVTLWFVIGEGWGVWGMIAATLVAEVVMCFVQLAVTASQFTALAKWGTWKLMARYGLPFVPHNIQSVGLDLFTMYMVHEMLGLGAVGLYGIAMKFASPIQFVVGSVQASWVPYKFQIHSEDANPGEFFRSAILYYVAALSYLWVGVSLWGPEVIRLVMPENFHGAADLMWSVALIPVTMGLFFMAGTGMELSDNTRPFPLVSFSGLVIMIAAAYVLIPWLGAPGAALATSAGWLAMAMVIYHLSQRRIAIPYDRGTILLFVAMAIVYVVAGLQLAGQPAWIRIAGITLLSLVYPLTGFLLMLRCPGERHRMIHLLSKVRLAAGIR